MNGDRVCWILDNKLVDIKDDNMPITIWTHIMHILYPTATFTFQREISIYSQLFVMNFQNI